MCFFVSELMSKLEFKKVMNDLELLEGDDVVFEIVVNVKFDFKV